jgi:hypothetical protein
MAFTIDYDDRDGILVCRLIGFLEEGDAQRFGIALSEGIRQARGKHTQLLVLLDNREGRVASQSAATDLIERLRHEKRPGDRTAIIVSDSLSKLQAKRVTTTEHEIFVSENAARTWLTAYRHTAGAA